MKRKKRVRVHLLDPSPEMRLPSVEGIMLRGPIASWICREYRIARTQLILAPEAKPTELGSRELRIPRERVAFYEVL